MKKKKYLKDNFLKYDYFERNNTSTVYSIYKEFNIEKYIYELLKQEQFNN